jgi:ribosomal RNA-processing protein 12
MDDALAKIRPHTSSSLPHQRSPANLLVALESTFNEQTTEASPTAYFAALLTTLDATIQKQDVALGDGDVLPAELYLLALIVPFVATPVIQTNLKTILALTGSLFPSLIPHAPALRSQLALYHVVFQSLDRSQLETPGIRQSFASILQLCIDPRPKVRKKAANVVRDMLASPPVPMARHPYAEAVADWAKSALAKVNSGPLPRAKAPDASGAEIAIHILAFLRPVLSNLPPPVSDQTSSDY